MSYRKFRAEYLFTGKKLLSGDEVLVMDSNGKVLDIIHENEAGENVKTFEGIISPGFVNAHCHLELSHLMGIVPENTGLIDFITKVVTLRHFAVEEIMDGINKAEREMVQNGIVAVGDICNNSFTVVQKLKKELTYYNFIEVSGWLPQGASVRFNHSKKFYEEYLENQLQASIVPHAPYSVSNNLWEKIIPFFAEKVISIHNQETTHEDTFFLEGTGDFNRMFEVMDIDNSFYKPQKVRNIPGYFEKLSLAASVILVHNTFMKQEDIDYINIHKPMGQLVSFCLCPNANLYIENNMPPVNLFINNDCHIILGTDSLASNHQLNILEEIKTIARHFPEIPTETMLGWATLNGARALKMDERLGSFDKHKTPGVILIDKVENGKLTASSKVTNLLQV